MLRHDIMGSPLHRSGLHHRRFGGPFFLTTSRTLVLCNICCFFVWELQIFDILRILKNLTVPCEASFVSVLHTFICHVLSSLVQSKNIPSWKTSGLSWSQKKQNHIFPKQTGWMNPTIKPLLHYRKMLPSN